MNFRRYVITRFVMLIPVIVGLSTIAFFISYSTRFPAGPYISPEMSAAQIQQVIIQHGFNQPWYVRYLYFWSDLLHGDLGFSASVGLPVTSALQLYFPATIELSVVALVIAIALGIPLGVSSAMKKGKTSDHVIRVLSLAGLSTPAFITAFILQYIFFFTLVTNGLPYLPATGRGGENVHFVTGFMLIDALLANNPGALLDWAQHIILPAICLASIIIAPITRLVRASLLETMGKEFVVQKRADGLSERFIIYRHVLRNALIPIVTSLGFIFGNLMGGAVITETVFAWPGVGRWVTFAITSGDIAAIMGFTIIIGVTYVLLNAIVDIAYVYIDPRIRLGGA